MQQRLEQESLTIVGSLDFTTQDKQCVIFKKLKIPLRVKIVATERRASADSKLGIFDGTDFNLNFDIIKCVERDDTDGVYCPCNFHWPRHNELSSSSSSGMQRCVVENKVLNFLLTACSLQGTEHIQNWLLLHLKMEANELKWEGNHSIFTPSIRFWSEIVERQSGGRSNLSFWRKSSEVSFDGPGAFSQGSFWRMNSIVWKAQRCAMKGDLWEKEGCRNFFQKLLLPKGWNIDIHQFKKRICSRWILSYVTYIYNAFADLQKLIVPYLDMYHSYAMDSQLRSRQSLFDMPQQLIRIMNSTSQLLWFQHRVTHIAWNRT